MSLQFILGASGSGKSHRLYQTVIEDSIRQPKQNYLVIVPEQFTMGTQQKMVQMHPNHGVMNIDILSFPRLAYRVFEELGIREGEILDDTGKSLMIRKVLENKKDELTVFNKNKDKPGFVEEVKSAISEMLQYGVSPDDLEHVSTQLPQNPLLSYKLKDMITVYRGFRECIEGKFLASEELLSRLCEVVSRSAIIKDSIVTLDGFTGFTPIQYRLIELLMRYCRKVIVTITIDSAQISQSGTISDLFYLSKNTIVKLKEIAIKSLVDIDEDLVMEDAKPIRLADSEALTFLEKNLFRYHGNTYAGKESVHVFEARMPKNEINYVTGEIKRLIMEEGYHYRDFAIVSADIETYGELASNILSQNNIPNFLDYKRNIMGNPAVNFLRSAMQVVEEDFSYDSVFGLLKTGMTDLTKEEIDLLENYCLALGKRGFKQYCQTWTRTTRLMTKNDITIEEINRIREKVVALLEIFCTQIKKCKTVFDYCKVLYEFMVHCALREKIEQWATQFEERGDLSHESEYKQTYKKIIALLDKFVNLLGDEPMRVKEFNDILDAGFGEIKVGLIPQSIDSVTIGDIERTRLENVKVLFIVGVNDGTIPKQSGGGGILSELDKEVLKEQNIELSMTEREKVFVQKFYLYLNMTKPSKHLYLTYAKIGNDGKSKKISYLIYHVMKLFPQIPILTDDDIAEELRMVQIPKAQIQWKFAKEFLDEDVAENLYGTHFKTSISAVEKFSACAFAHFVLYGLRLSERENYDIKASDIGTLYHNTLELYSEKLMEQQKSFTDISQEEQEMLVKQCVDIVTGDYGNSILTSTRRNEFLIERLQQIATRTVWAVTKQMEAGDFTTTQIEKEIDNSYVLTGRIDRIDTFEDEEHVYVKVVDYKTGKQDFDLLETYYGLNIQLITYMNAALAMEKRRHPDKKIVPAAMFYYQIHNPFAEEKADGKKDVETQLLENLRVKGLVNSDKQVLAALDRETTGKSLVAPFKYNAGGELSKDSSVMDAENLSNLFTHVDFYVKDSYDAIKAGEIEVNPFMLKKETGCDHCSYRAICGFDPKIRQCEYRVFPVMPEEELLRKISQGEEE